MKSQKLLTVSEAAKRYGVNDWTIYRWVRECGMPARKSPVGGAIKFDPKETDQWLEPKPIQAKS